MNLLTIVAQVAGEVTPDAVEEVTAVQESIQAASQTPFIDFGPGVWQAISAIIYIAIILISIIGLAVFLERLFYLNKINSNTKKLMASIKVALRANRVMEAIGICNNAGGPTANILKVGLENYKKDRGEIRMMMEDAASSEIPKLERRLWLMSIGGKVAPMLGLLGTVLGMIRSFTVMSASEFDPAQLAGGISMALITTALGLIVAIPLLLGYSYLVERVNQLIADMETRAGELIAALSTRQDTGKSKADTFKI